MRAVGPTSESAGNRASAAAGSMAALGFSVGLTDVCIEQLVLAISAVRLSVTVRLGAGAATAGRRRASKHGRGFSQALAVLRVSPPSLNRPAPAKDRPDCDIPSQ